MAKTQTRRAVSLNGAVYRAVQRAAAESGVTVSQYVTGLIRRSLPDMPRTRHVGIEEMAKVRAAKAQSNATSSRSEQLRVEISRIRGVLGRLEGQL